MIHVLYQRIHDYLTNDWRGTDWHRTLVRRWTDRQHRMHTTATPRDEFVRSHTQHWSMLPETLDLISDLARHHRELSTATDVSRALDLEHYETELPPASVVTRAHAHRSTP